MEQIKLEEKSQIHSQSDDDDEDNRLRFADDDDAGNVMKTLKISKWKPPASDDEDETHQFSVSNAWEMLLGLDSCQRVMIKEPSQKQLQIVVGVNISQEFPWKQIRFKFLRDQFDHFDNGDDLTKYFSGYPPEHYVLIGYAPLLTQNQDNIPEGDPFILYVDSQDAKVALAIIRNIELYERWMMNKRLIKKPRRWVTQGSEDEICVTLQQRQAEPMDVEIQSVYPLTIPADKEFTFRKCANVRDGYVELLPGELMKFDNITRKRVSVGIQSVPACVDLEQQTDPTFPTNAWAQYLYEIDEGEELLDESSEDEATKEQQARRHSSIKELGRQSAPGTPVPQTPLPPKPPPEVSDQIKFLLKTLEFNQIDMYRTLAQKSMQQIYQKLIFDYPISNDYPAISEQQIVHYTNPYLEETLCFANISKSYQRYVCGISWFPAVSGLIVTSYTFNTVATIDLVTDKVDTVQRAVLQANPILMWSFSDNLNYKLEFESPLEVTVLSFCPYIANLLIGGTKCGRIIVWDLQDRVEKFDVDEILTAAQSTYRDMISDFLKWTIQINEDSTVVPVIITGQEVSQKATITGIHWMGCHFYINSFGKVYTDPDTKNSHKFFITCSMDGTITFWDIDAVREKKTLAGASSRRDQPKALTQSESIYKNRELVPIFTVVFNEPITSLVGDTSVFTCIVAESSKKRKNLLNYQTKLVTNDPLKMRQSLVVASFYGRIERVNWLGLYADADGRENLSLAMSFARVHDGPIIDMKKNPFYPSVFVSIGRNVFAVWKEDYNYSPIFWRNSVCDITAVSWSTDRPAVLFLTHIDGSFQAWDILARDDDACLNDVLGGGIVTAISEHGPSEPNKLLGIGDYNSSFRMVVLPQSFYVQVPNELEMFQEYILKEETRKKSIQSWEQKYYENNRDVIEAKIKAETDARAEMERIEKDEIFQAARRAKEAAEEKKNLEAPLSHLPYTERMKRLWDELNLNRLLNILMSRKRVDEAKLERETALEKRHLSYEAAKKESLIETLKHAAEDVATVRSRILPVQAHDLQRNDMILSAVDELMLLSDSYANIEEEANATINSFDNFDTIDYLEFLLRGEHRRLILDKSLGGNTERLYWYEWHKSDQLLDDCNWGYENFMSANVDLMAKETDKDKLSLEEPTEQSDD